MKITIICHLAAHTYAYTHMHTLIHVPTHIHEHNTHIPINNYIYVHALLYYYYLKMKIGDMRRLMPIYGQYTLQ